MHLRNPPCLRAPLLLLFLIHSVCQWLFMSSLGCKDINFLVLGSIFLSSSLASFKKMLPSILQGRYPGVYVFDETFAAERGFEKLSSSSEVLFSNLFLRLRLFEGVRFQYSKVLVAFVLSERPKLYLIW